MPVRYIDRAALFDWGSGLDDVRLGRALAAAGVVREVSLVPDRFVTGALTELTRGALRWRAGWLGRDERWPRSRQAAGAWSQLRAAAGSRKVRLRIDGQGLSVDLLRLLAQPEVADSAWCHIEAPERIPDWSLPLRVAGLGPGGFVQELHQQAADHVGTRPASPRRADLLFVAGDLRRALAELMSGPTGLRVDLLVVLGDVGAPEAGGLIDALRDAVDPGGIAVFGSGPDTAHELAGRLFDELCHDLTLDLALSAAGRQVGVRSLLWLSKPLLKVAHPRVAAKKLAYRLRRLAVEQSLRPLPVLGFSSFHEAADRLTEIVLNGLFEHESNETAELVAFSDALALDVPAEAFHPDVLSMAAVDGGHEPPSPAERWLQGRFARDTVDGLQPQAHALLTGEDYLLEARIARRTDDEDWESSAAPISDDDLPFEAGPVRVTLAFTELPRSEDDLPPPPQVRRILLPKPPADSPTVRFPFSVRPGPGRFEARLTALHDGRVLQTMRLSAAVAADPEPPGPIELVRDSQVIDGMGTVARRRQFDAAFVFNEGESGVASTSWYFGEEAGLLATSGLTPALQGLRAAFKSYTATTETAESISKKRLETLLTTLAHRGRLLWKPLAKKLPPDAISAGRIQLVGARPEALVPLEICYRERAPDVGSKLCEQWKTALAEGCSDCPHQGAAFNDLISPTAFWGLSAVFERREAHLDADAAGTAPTRPQTSIGGPVLVGLSERVKAAGAALVKELEGISGSVRRVVDLDAWETAVGAEAPAWFVLLPHTGKSEFGPTMELGGPVLTASQLETTHMRPDGSTKAPLVLLVGCSTAFDSEGFQGLLPQFLAAEASCVVATLASIDGPRAAGAVRRLEYGDPLKRILVDGGTHETWPFLKAKLEALDEDDRHFELLVITHVDDDHILGVLEMLQRRGELGLTFGDIWFNGWTHLHPNNVVLGPKQGEMLTTLLSGPTLPWNKLLKAQAEVINRGAVATHADGCPRELAVDDDLKAWVLAPTPANLASLVGKWDTVVTKAGIVPGHGAPPVMLVDDHTLGNEEFADLLKAKGGSDSSPSNGSSIVLLVEADGASFLLTGDGKKKPITDGVKKMAKLRDAKRLAVDLFKLPHHGSAYNVSPTVLKKLDCSSYLVSTNGDEHGHPHDAAIAWTIRHGRPANDDDVELLFNYKTEFNYRWGGDLTLQDEEGYSARYPASPDTGVWFPDSP